MADDDLTFSPSSPLVTTPAVERPVSTTSPSVDYDREIQESLRGSREYIGRARESMEREEQIAGEKTRALEPLRQREMEFARQPLPQRPQRVQTPPVPRGNDPGADENWLWASALLGALAGAVTRRHLTNALAGMTGAIEGYQEGSREKFNQNMKIWDAEHKRAVEANEQAMTEYREILEDRKLTKEQMSLELELAGQKYQDVAMQTAARTKNDLVIAQLYDTQVKAAEQLKLNHERLTQQRTLAESRERAAALRRGGVQMSPDAVDLRADMWIAGNPLALRGVKAGSEDYAAISTRMAEKAKELNLSAKEITQLQAQFPGEQAYARTAGNMAARVEAATNEVVTLAPQAVEASHALPRGSVVPLNKLLQDGVKVNIPTQGEFNIWLGQKQLSDPRYNDFLIASFSLSNAYGRAMNPQGVPRVEEARTREAIGLLSTATSPQAYDVQVRRLLLEVKASQEAVKRTRQGVQGAENIDQLIERLQLKAPPTVQEDIQDYGRGGTTNIPFGTRTSEIPGYSIGRGGQYVAPGTITDWYKFLTSGGTVREVSQ